MPPEYHLKAFWTNRFKREKHFEWLGDGQETIIPIIRDYLRRGSSDRDKFSLHKIPRTLHIGAGTSTLSEHILAVYRDAYGDAQQKDIIVNTDFADQAGQQGKATANIDGVVKWETLDMLNWKDVAKKLRSESKESNGDGFAIVVDKSTSDAISCAPDIRLNHKDGATGECPTTVTSLVRSSPATDPGFMEPVELLALHLAALVHPQGIWVALSYSSKRFSFLTQPPSTTTHLNAAASLFWTVGQIIPVDAPSGQVKEGVHAPTVQHYLYVLERTLVVATDDAC